MPECFKTEAVENKRLFVVETFMHYGTRFQLSLYWLFLFNRLKKQILEHFSMLY